MSKVVEKDAESEAKDHRSCIFDSQEHSRSTLNDKER